MQVLASIQRERQAAVAAAKGTVSRRCCVCGKEEGASLKLKICSACKHPDETYCSTECQAAAWKGGHKSACARKKKEMSVELGAGLFG